jgi:hypothetical protein
LAYFHAWAPKQSCHQLSAFPPSAIFEDPEVEPSLPTILPEPEVPTATILPEPTEFEDEPMDCKTLSNLTYNELAAMHVWPMVSKASEVYANILSGMLQL